MSTFDSDRPQPRPGVDGWVDRLTGPGATPGELALQFGVAAAGGIGAGIWYAVAGDGRLWLIAVAVLLGFDLGGGVVTNATTSAKRWFHREGQGFVQHLGFIALHMIHLAVIAVFVLPLSWHYFLVASGILLGGAVVILLAPPALTRPTAFAVFGLVLVIHGSVLPVPPGFEWFTPILFLKLFVSHLVPENESR